MSFRNISERSFVADFLSEVPFPTRTFDSTFGVFNGLRASSSLRGVALFLPRCQVRLVKSCTESSGRKNKVVFMRTDAYLLATALACGLAGTTISVTSSSGETIQRTVHGTVVATNVDVDPQIIVVEVVLPHEEELVVGARVATDTKIMKGKQAARLADIQAGEKATITYLKTLDGLIARSIHVR